MITASLPFLKFDISKTPYGPFITIRFAYFKLEGEIFKGVITIKGGIRVFLELRIMLERGDGEIRVKISP